MNPRDPNVQQLQLVAQALGHLREKLVFVGGCATGILITDDARPPVRATQDVDLIAEITTKAKLYELGSELRNLGFQEDQTANVVKTCFRDHVTEVFFSRRRFWLWIVDPFVLAARFLNLRHCISNMRVAALTCYENTSSENKLFHLFRENLNAVLRRKKKFENIWIRF